MAIISLKNNPSKPLPIGLTENIAYGMGDFASCMLYVGAQTFLMYYYTEFAGVNMAIVALIMLFSRIFDGVTDVIMGHIIEHTRSPLGKARCWIFKMLIPFTLGSTLLFSVPQGWNEASKLIYIFFTYNFTMSCVYTAINLPYGAMSASMTQDQKQRTILVLFRMVLAAAGQALIVNITMPLVNFFGADAKAWTYTFLVVGFSGSVIFFFTFLFCHERIQTNESLKNGSVANSLKCLFTNKYWLMLTIAFFCVYTADVTFNTVNIYYCKYFLSDDGLVGIFGTIFNISRLVVMIAIIPILVRYICKRNMLLLACILMIISVSVRLAMPYSMNAFYVGSLFWGLGQGFAMANLYAMIPDTVEYGEYKDGVRHEGYIYAGASFSSKVAGGLGPVIMGFILSLAGYIPNAQAQHDNASQAILMTSTLVPMIILFVAIIAMAKYRLDKEYPHILEEIKTRKQKEFL